MADEPGVLDALKKIGAKIPIVGGIVEGVSTFAPSLEDEATVEIVGQPGSTKKQLYYLGLATAFSLCRRVDLNLGGIYTLPPPGVLMIEYDAADHWVRVTLRYKTSLLQNAAAKFSSFIAPTLVPIAGIARVVSYESLPVYAGPKCEVVGAPFDFTGELPIATVGIPSSSKDPLAPKLPFAGKTILTTCAMVADPNPALGAKVELIPSPNPKPPGDNRSRGAVVTGGGKKPGSESNFSSSPSSPGTDPCCLTKSMSLIPLVFTALTDPGSYNHEIFHPPTSGPLGS